MSHIFFYHDTDKLICNSLDLLSQGCLPVMCELNQCTTATLQLYTVAARIIESCEINEQE